MSKHAGETFAKAKKAALDRVEASNGPVMRRMVGYILEALLTSTMVIDFVEPLLAKIAVLDLMARQSSTIVQMSVEVCGVSRETGSRALDIAKTIHTDELIPLMKTLVEEADDNDHNDALRDLFESLKSSRR